jgi:hypothetical protein
MAICGFLRRLSILPLVGLALVAGASDPARASTTGCPSYSSAQYFLPWLDPAYYTLAPNGGLENGATSWLLSGGAKVVSGSESFRVRGAADRYSLALPSGSSATTGTTCVRTLDATMRLFVTNGGSLLSTLKVEVLYKDALGLPRAQTVGLLAGTARWSPSLPTLLLANLLYPPLLTDGHVDVAFRFTPLGPLSGWRIDDVYVDPFKGA